MKVHINLFYSTALLNSSILKARLFYIEFFTGMLIFSRDLHVKKGMENLDTAQISGPTGRIIQTFPDSSLLLELTRPVNAPFGFVISRGKGRPDSGTALLG